MPAKEFMHTLASESPNKQIAFGDATRNTLHTTFNCKQMTGIPAQNQGSSNHEEPTTPFQSRSENPKTQLTAAIQSGFTLMELLIVVVILGILSAIAIPSFMNQRIRAEKAAGKAEASSLARKCATALLSKEIEDAPTKKEVSSAKNATEISSCDTQTGGSYKGGDTIFTVEADGSITETASKP
jgi:prepilin-type N-terminal cleavage/methylation domain-containing protein